ncbi:MAG: hypothetical protein JW760_11370 [Spirochaetales bacterium]|nr:hypothetical protein [Spirochaetales bacterium]
MLRRITLLFFLFSSALPAAAAPFFGFTGEYGPGKKAVHTFTLAEDDVMLALLHSSKEGLPRYAAFAFTFPGIRFGSMTRQGLLKELELPAGYGQGSSVFTEPTGCFADYTPGKAAPQGAVFYREEDRRTDQLLLMLRPYPQMGSISGLTFGALSVQAAGLYSRPEKAEPQDSWFSCNPRVLSQGLFHGALETRGTFGPLTLATAAGFCLPRYSRQGFFLRFSGEYSSDLLKAEAAAAGCSETYLAPSGEAPDKVFRLGARVTIPETGRLKTVAGAAREVKRLSLLPDLQQGVTDQAEASLILDLPPWKSVFFFGRRIDWMSDGSGGITDTLRMDLKISFPAGSLAGELRVRKVDATEPALRGKLEASFTGDKLSLALSLVHDSDEGFSLGLRGSFKGSSCRFTAGGDTQGTVRAAFRLEEKG